ncbi:MAG: PAS domain S-box protein [Stigonema ocellatum SAG 48.90 = DSM 106950]|nr:PAS domain S-box protein [Stigonema ocellatum SAG 48.90 = DSM 106950]
MTINYVEHQGKELICAFVRQRSDESRNFNSKTVTHEQISQQRHENFPNQLPPEVKIPGYPNFRFPIFKTELNVQQHIDISFNVKEVLQQEVDIVNTESELATSLCILRSTLDSAANGILAVNFDGEVVYCNQKFLDMWHLPKSIEMSKKCNQAKSFFESQVKYPELFNSCVWEMSAQLDRESYDLIELKDGRIFAHYSEPQRLGAKIIGRVWSIWDITESKRTEEALKLSAARFRTLAETTDASIFLIQERGICYVNPAAEVLTGYTQKELVNGFNIDQLFKAKKLRQVHQQEGAASGEYQEIQIITKKGIVRWLACTVEVLDGVLDFASQPVKMITAIDITDYKNAESELRQALDQAKRLSELRERFVSMLCHQFRTPLNVVAFSADLLRRHLHQWPEEKNRSYLDVIQAAVKQISELLDEILLFGRAEAAKLKCDPRPIDIHQFCRDIIAQVQLASGNQRLINFVSLGNCTNIHLDPKLLQHILTNLLSNAINYSPTVSTVIFELCCQNEDVIFKIKDAGIGIPVVNIQQIFEPFYRGSNVDSIPGTGLGLSIVKTLVELHGGEIAVESVVGVGTTFTVKLPSTNIQLLSLVESL